MTKLRYYRDSKQMFHVCEGEEEEEHMTIAPRGSETFECPHCGATWDRADWDKAKRKGEA